MGCVSGPAANVVYGNGQHVIEQPNGVDPG